MRLCFLLVTLVFSGLKIKTFGIKACVHMNTLYYRTKHLGGEGGMGLEVLLMITLSHDKNVSETLSLSCQFENINLMIRYDS